MSNDGPIVVKIGGSTLGAEDTTLDDVAALSRSGRRMIVVHGGGAMITDWLTRLEVPSEFVDGLRSTSAQALEVVVAVLRGVINAQLVAEIGERGGRLAPGQRENDLARLLEGQPLELVRQISGMQIAEFRRMG